MKRRWIIAAAAVFCILLAHGCAAMMNETAASDMLVMSPQASEPVRDQAAETETGYDASYGVTGGGSKNSGGGALSLDAGDAAAAADAEERYGGRKVILTYEASLETDEFDAVMDALEQRLAVVGGYVQNSYVDGKKPEAYGDRGRTASLTLRVPADQAERFYTDVKALGTLLSEHAYGDDVTAEYFDRETRLEVLEIQLERLKNILVQTDNLADVLALEAEIARVTLEIEELTGELRRYDALIDYATVVITLRETSLREGPAAAKSVGERIAEGFSDSLHGVGAFFVDVFVWLVSSLPVLAVLGIAVLAVVLLIRGMVKRGRARRAARQSRNDTNNDNLYGENKKQ